MSDGACLNFWTMLSVCDPSASGRIGKLLLQFFHLTGHSSAMSVVKSEFGQFADLLFTYQMLTPGAEPEKQGVQATL